MNLDYMKKDEWNIKKNKIDNCNDVSLENVIRNDYVYKVNEIGPYDNFSSLQT
jgi:Zn-finger domain-containing protein